MEKKKMFDINKGVEEKIALKVLGNITESVMVLSKDFKILWANKNLINSTHLKADNIFGNFCYKVTHHRETPCSAPHDICPIKEVLKTGKPITVLHTHFDKEGNESFDEVSAYPVKDVNGEITQFVHISRDVTGRVKAEKALVESERKRAAEFEKAYKELQETKDMLVQAEKFTAIGQLASGVAHEVKNPLGIIIQSVNYLEEEISPDQKDALEILDMIKGNVKRADKIIRALLDFSKAAKLKLQPEDINSILKKSLSLVKYEFKFENIKIIDKTKKDIPNVFVDKGRMEQVFVNLLLNAVQAILGEGKIIISSHEIKLKEIKKCIGRREDDFFEVGERAVVVEVEDTGKGIPEESLQKVFDPFFTTKSPRGGSGLGLSVTRNIISMHRGLIDIRSQVNKGTKVVITLKIA